MLRNVLNLQRTCSQYRPWRCFSIRQSGVISPVPSSGVRFHGNKPAADAPTVNFTFVNADGTEIPVSAKQGLSILDVAHANEVDLEGACESSLACSTCHVILEEGVYDKLEEPCEEEEDMLDLAFGLTDTSRLGCQVIVTTELEGMRVQLPAATRNFYVDGHKPKPH